MFVVDLLGYNFRGPLVGGGITVTVKDLGGVIAQQGVGFVFTVAPVCVQKDGLDDPKNCTLPRQARPTTHPFARVNRSTSAPRFSLSSRRKSSI
jgi:hypothetical protein